MKQKIFSLLVLMLASVSSAWALSPTYTLKASIGTAETLFNNISLTGQTQTLTEETIEQFVIDQYDDPSSVTECIVNTVTVQQSADGVTLNGMSISISSPFNTTATFKVEAKLKTGTSTSYNVEYMEDNALTLQLDLFHDQHIQASQYSKDAEGHWYACTNENGQCEYEGKIDYNIHNWSGHSCSDCEMDQPHSFDLWKEDPENSGYHYAKCSIGGCGLELGDYQEPTLEDMVYEAHTYSNANGNPCVCTKCGHLNHDPALLYTQTDDAHYYACINPGCPLNSTSLTESAFTDAEKSLLKFGYHIDEDPVDGICDECEYAMNAQVDDHIHDFTSQGVNVYDYNDNYHWLVCQITNPVCPLDYTAIAAYTEANNSDDDLLIQGLVEWAEHNYNQADNTKCVCGKTKPAPVHEHSFSGDWTKTATHHYHKCTIENCPLNSDNLTAVPSNITLTSDDATAFAFAAHADNSTPADGLCDVCGAQMSTPVHEHSFSGDWEKDANVHYKKCNAEGCDLDYNNLSDDDKILVAYGEHQYGTNPGDAYYYTCLTCDYKNPDRMEAHTCVYGSWNYNDDKHWKSCTVKEGYCPAPTTEEGEHSFGTDIHSPSYYKCVCGYVNKNRKSEYDANNHVHSFSSNWTQEPDVHYHKCISRSGTCDLVYDGSMDLPEGAKFGEHVYGTSKEVKYYYTCKTCEYENAARKSENHSHEYGDWQYDNNQHWKECLTTAGACSEPKKSQGFHTYGTSGDARWTCKTCGFSNDARKEAIKNAETAANVQSWCWDYEIPFNFEATVQNDRRFNAEQCYTIFLPYALELNGLKAYTIEQHNDNIVGFKEQAVTELPQLTPFVVKSETTGNPLSSAMTTVYATLLSADQADWMTADEKAALISERGYANSQASIHSTGGRLYMLGTLRYLVGNEANGRYIMQGKDVLHPNGVFKMISGTDEDNAGYDKVDNRACILPMRAHIETLGGDSREFLGVRLIKADGSVTTIDRLVLNPDDNTVYDLQGRRVQNPRKGGLYIINGKKTILK